MTDKTPRVLELSRLLRYYVEERTRLSDGHDRIDVAMSLARPRAETEDGAGLYRINAEITFYSENDFFAFVEELRFAGFAEGIDL